MVASPIATWHGFPSGAQPSADDIRQAGSGRLCLDLGDTFRIIARIFDELFVYPAASKVAPPYCSPNEPTGDRPPRNDYPPEMPGIGPRLLQIRTDGRASIAAISHHWFASTISSSHRTWRRANWKSSQRQECRCQPFWVVQPFASGKAT